MAYLSQFDINLTMMILSVLAIFVAGIVRGYSGFGFALVAVTSMSLVFPPTLVVPIVLGLEIVASTSLLPQVWRDIDWRSLRWLLAGSLVAVPFGVYLLASIPPAPMRISIAVTVLAAAVLLRKGFTLKRMPSTAASLGTGAASGILNGAAALGGPPVILFYLSSPAGVTVSRASMITYFLGIDIISLAAGAAHGLITTKTGLLFVLLLPPLLVGVAIGSRLFANVGEADFRRHVLYLLMILSISVLLRAVWG